MPNSVSPYRKKRSGMRSEQQSLNRWWCLLWCSCHHKVYSLDSWRKILWTEEEDMQFIREETWGCTKRRLILSSIVFLSEQKKTKKGWQRDSSNDTKFERRQKQPKWQSNESQKESSFDAEKKRKKERGIRTTNIDTSRNNYSSRQNKTEHRVNERTRQGVKWSNASVKVDQTWGSSLFSLEFPVVLSRVREENHS